MVTQVSACSSPSDPICSHGLRCLLKSSPVPRVQVSQPFLVLDHIKTNVCKLNQRFPSFLLKDGLEGYLLLFLLTWSHPLVYLIYLPNQRPTQRMIASPFLTAISPLHIKFLLHAVAAPWPQMHFELRTTMAKQPMSLFADNPYPCTLSLKSEKFPLNL